MRPFDLLDYVILPIAASVYLTGNTLKGTAGRCTESYVVYRDFVEKVWVVTTNISYLPY